MLKKTVTLFILTLTLSNFNILINQSRAMEVEFASSFLDPNSTDFTQTIDKILQPNNRKTQSRLVDYLLHESTLPHKNALLSICQLFKIQDHQQIKFETDFLFQTLEEALNDYPSSALFQHGMGYCFGEGTGTEKNLQKEKDFYEKATAGNFSFSFYNLAHMYEEGIYTKKNISKAIELYEKSIELDNSWAMCKLAHLYKTTIDIEKNITETIELYEKAIKTGNSYAMYYLAYMYETGFDIEKNIPKAIKLYEKAIEGDNSLAMCKLAHLYQVGIDTQKKIPKAIELYEKAIERHNPLAMYNLAHLYETGIDVEQNISKAIELCEKAIEVDVDDSLAMCKLGHLYETKKNISKAIELYKKYFLRGSSDGRIKLFNLLSFEQQHQRLIELEFEYSHLFFDFSKPFVSLLESQSSLVQETILSFTKKKPKEDLLVFSDGKRDHPLKDIKKSTVLRRPFEKLAPQTEKIFSLPRVLLYKIALEFDNPSFFSLCCTSKHFAHTLYEQGIERKIIFQEMKKLEKNFLNKIEKQGLKEFYSEKK